MTTSYTLSNTFTVTHARQIASRVATDLQRFQRFYGSPSDEWITKYEGELIHLLQHDVIKDVTYGFKRNGMFTEASVKYKALPGGTLDNNADPGKIRPNLDVTGAHFTSYLTYNSNWSALSQSQRDAIKAGCPYQRTSGTEPALEAGHYWADDHSYVAGGRGLGRSSVRK